MNIECKTNFKIPTGITGLDSIVFPAVTKKIFVSFNAKDCHKTNLEVLTEAQIDDAISLINANKSIYNFIFNKIFSVNPSLAEKKAIILKAGLMGYMVPLENQDIKYFAKLFEHLSCFTGLEFEMVKELDEQREDYKISICGTIDNVLRNTKNEDAHTFVSLEEKPTQCLILVDNIQDDDPFAVDRENTLGHEFFHCL